MTMTLPTSPGEIHAGTDEGTCTASTESETDSGGGEPVELDQSILSSAISSEMPTFLHTTGVPIIHRRKKKLVTSAALARAQRQNLPPKDPTYPPGKPLCLRGHTPAMNGSMIHDAIRPPVRVRPRRSVRGPRGVVDIPAGRFLRPGVLGGLSISPWVVEEETERVSRAAAHKYTLSKDSLVFRRKREEGGLLDYAEETHAIKRFLSETHPIRDESCPSKSGFSYRRVNHEKDPPDFYDTRLDSVRPRTVGYSPGHVRSLSPTPGLTWGGRDSSRTSLEWGDDTRGALGLVEASLGGAEQCGSRRLRPHSVLMGGVSKCQSWAVKAFGSEQKPGDNHGNIAQDALEDDAGREEELEIRPMWSRQATTNLDIWASSASYTLRPFSSSCDHLGRPLTREGLSRSTASLKPQQFDTLQRRSEFSGALAAKQYARRARAVGEAEAQRQETERMQNALEEREGIRNFEGSLKEVLAQKWKYL